MLGYARAVEERDGALESQIETLAGLGIEPRRIYTDVAARATENGTAGEGAGESLVSSRPGMAALLDYARSGDVVVVVALDRLGRSSAEVLEMARIFGDRGIGLRSLREQIDTEDAAGAMLVGVLASLSRVDDERAQRRRRSSPHLVRSGAGRPRALTADQVRLAESMRAKGESVPEIAGALGVSRATLYRSLAERKSVK